MSDDYRGRLVSALFLFKNNCLSLHKQTKREMLLVNKKLLTDLPEQVERYEKGVKFLKHTYGDSIKFIRPGHPRRNKGIDAKGREVPNMTEPSPPMRIPLDAEVNTDSGMEIWSYCDGSPELLPNNLWKPTGKRGLSVSEHIVLNLASHGELAYFLYYKSPFMKAGLLAINDPVADAKQEGDKARAELDLQTALYATLGDEEQLRVVAQAYGVAKADTKHPDTIRKELRSIVVAGDIKKRSDPTARGIREFLDELKITDSVRLRSLVMTSIDDKKIEWYPDGKYKVGDRELCKVPQGEIIRRQDYLCNHLLKAPNKPKLQELLKDVVTRAYLDKISDDKTFIWLAKVMDLPHNFKKIEEVKELVFACFVTE